MINFRNTKNYTNYNEQPKTFEGSIFLKQRMRQGCHAALCTCAQICPHDLSNIQKSSNYTKSIGRSVMLYNPAHP